MKKISSKEGIFYQKLRAESEKNGPDALRPLFLEEIRLFYWIFHWPTADSSFTICSKPPLPPDNSANSLLNFQSW